MWEKYGESAEKVLKNLERKKCGKSAFKKYGKSVRKVWKRCRVNNLQCTRYIIEVLLREPQCTVEKLVAGATF